MTEWLTTAQACAYLGVCRRTLQNMRHRKVIPVSRLSTGTVRYSRASLDKALSKRERFEGR